MTETPTERRFWSKVQKSEEGCWLWTGQTVGGRYGRLSWDGRMQLAHRVSYRLAVGEIPDGMCVCHHCDVPACVRPDHLFLGTHTDNMRDAARKGRNGIARHPERSPFNWVRKRAHGLRNGNGKFGDKELIEALAMKRSGHRSIDVARKFGMSTSYVRQLVRGAVRPEARALLTACQEDA